MHIEMKQELKTNIEPQFDVLGFLLGFMLFGLPAFVFLFVTVFRWGHDGLAVRWALAIVPSLIIGSIGGFKMARKKIYKHE